MARLGFFVHGKTGAIQWCNVLLFLCFLLTVTIPSSSEQQELQEQQQQHQEGCNDEMNPSCLSRSNNKKKNNNNDNNDSNSCTFYMATSTIPNAGFGVYTTKSFHKGDVVLSADSPVIPVPDLKKKVWAQKDYVWATYAPSAFEGNHVSDSVMTMGSLPNYHTSLKNVSPDYLKNIYAYDDTLVNRFTDHEAGAFSYYLGYDFLAKRNIIPGEEIFASYGEGWLNNRDQYEDIPRSDDYEKGDEIVAAIGKHLPNPSNEVLSTIKSISSIMSKRVSSTLPNSKDDFQTVAQSTKSFHTARSLSSTGWHSVEHHTLDWIQTNGLCLDNLLPGPSTIPKAGKGGIAARFIPKDSIIVPAPICQIPNRDILDMKPFTPSKGESIPKKQLITNYCFGRPESSLLLCPNTNAILINHCSDRHDWGGSCSDGQGPNADYRWATDWDPDTEDWLKMTIDEMIEHGGRGLSLEIFATRDIQPGEEVFIDYGTEWEKAWFKHKASWISPQKNNHLDGFTTWESTKQWNDDKVEPRTEEELDSNPYPENIMTACVYWDSEYEEPLEIPSAQEVEDMSLEEAIDIYGEDGQKYVANMDTIDDATFWPCAILEREDDEEGKESYTVRIDQTPNYDDTHWMEHGIPRLLTNFPRSSIRFFNEFRRSDQHLPGAFRHPIVLKDELFPDQWRDRGFN